MRIPLVGLTVLALSLAPVVFAQEADETQGLSHDTIIELNESGVAESVLIKMIETTPGTVPPSPSEIIRLTEAGVPAGVIEALLGTAASDAANSARAEPVFVDSNNPADPHTYGIWTHAMGDDSEARMQLLQPARVIAQESGGGLLGGLARRGGGIAGTFGGAAVGGVTGAVAGGVAGDVAAERLDQQKIKVVFDGKNADIAVNREAAFYIYLDASSAPAFGQPSLFAQITHPNDFSLIKLDRKSDRRELEVMSYNSFGQRVGVDDAIDFTVEPVRSGVFKVTPEKRLDDDKEYAFVSNIMYNSSPLYGGTMIPPNVFDFSVPNE